MLIYNFIYSIFMTQSTKDKYVNLVETFEVYHTYEHNGYVPFLINTLEVVRWDKNADKVGVYSVEAAWRGSRGSPVLTSCDRDSSSLRELSSQALTLLGVTRFIAWYPRNPYF